MKASDEEVWARINSTDFRRGYCQTTLKEIDMWLRPECVGSRGTVKALEPDHWPYGELSAVMRLQVDLTRGYRKWDRSQHTLEVFPAFEIDWRDRPEWPAEPAPRPSWLEERWEAGLMATTYRGATRGRMVALVNHPVWRTLSDMGRPFGPFFTSKRRNGCVSGSDAAGISIAAVMRRDVLSLGLLEAQAEMPPFVPWPDEGRLSLDEWRSIRGRERSL